MQDHKEAWPNRVCAIWDSVSPLRTMILVAVRKEEAIEGRKTCEPASMWLASTIAGLTSRMSCQRMPLPKFSSASFHRDSPGLTTTTFSLPGVAGAMAAAGFAGVEANFGGREGFASTTGGVGCAGVASAATFGDGITRKSGAGAAGLEGVAKKPDVPEGVMRTTGAAGCAGVASAATFGDGITLKSGAGAAGLEGVAKKPDVPEGVMRTIGAVG